MKFLRTLANSRKIDLRVNLVDLENMLQNDSLVANIGFATAENGFATAEKSPPPHICPARSNEQAFDTVPKARFWEIRPGPLPAPKDTNE